MGVEMKIWYHAAIFVFLLMVSYSMSPPREQVDASKPTAEMRLRTDPWNDNSSLDDPISIEGNLELSVLADLGSGTETDPYIIQNRTIQASNGSAISLMNTSMFLIVRYITCHGSIDPQDPLINLVGCRNVTLERIDIFKPNIGISLQDSNDVLMEELYISECRDRCLAIVDSRDFSIEGSYFNGDSSERLHVTGSSGFSVSNNHFEGSRAIRCISITGSNDLSIGSNLITNISGTAIGIENSHAINISKNSIHGDRNGYGISLHGTYDLLIFSNQIIDNKIGIELKNNIGSYSGSIRIYDNTVGSNIKGMSLFEKLVGVELDGNAIDQNTVGVEIYGYGAIVMKNVFTKNDIGSFLDTYRYYEDNLIIDNHFTEHRIGIWSSSCNKIINNTFHECTSAVVVEGSDGDYPVEGNVISDCDAAVKITNSFCISIVRNHFSNNIRTIEVTNSYYLQIYNNFFRETSESIHIEGSHNIDIFNNYFHAYNISLKGNDNHFIYWNVDRVQYSNIVGGPYVCGNYWYDYGGEDIDGDGIGDTMLPHRGDLGPIVTDWPMRDIEPPTVLDRTPGHPVTGRDFSVKYQVSDDRNLFGSRAEIAYTLKDGDHTDDGSMDARIDGSGLINTDIFIFEWVKIVEIIVTVSDFSNNMANYTFAYDVLDGTPPVIANVQTYHTANTGQDWQIYIDLKDNHHIDHLTAEFRFDDETDIKEISNGWNLDEDTWTIKIPIDENCTIMDYRLIAYDEAGLYAVTEWYEVRVIDTIPPMLEYEYEDLPENGDLFHISFMMTDNVKVGGMELRTSFDSVKYRTIMGQKLIRIDDRQCIADFIVNIPEDRSAMWFDIRAWDVDPFGNINNEGFLDGLIPIIDNIKPEIIPLREGSNEQLFTGQKGYFCFESRDNIAVVDGFFSFQFNDGISDIITGIPSIVKVDVPDNVTFMHYTAGVVDGNGNWRTLSGRIGVVDVLDPTISMNLQGPIGTGSEIAVRLNCSDNIGLEVSGILYSFNAGNLDRNAPISQDGSYRIRIPLDADTLHLKAYARDENWNEVFAFEQYTVYDSTPPVICSYRIVEIEKDRVRFMMEGTDNREIRRAWIVVDSGNSHIAMNLTEGFDGSYHGVVWKKDLAGNKLDCRFYIADMAGNTAFTPSIDHDLGGPDKFPWAVIWVVVVLLLIIGSIAFYLYRRGRFVVFEREIPDPNDPYVILEIRRGSSVDKIKKRYRELAKRYHPDKTGKENEEQMKRINKARDELLGTNTNTYSFEENG